MDKSLRKREKKIKDAIVHRDDDDHHHSDDHSDIVRMSRRASKMLARFWSNALGESSTGAKNATRSKHKRTQLHLRHDLDGVVRGRGSFTCKAIDTSSSSSSSNRLDPRGYINEYVLELDLDQGDHTGFLRHYEAVLQRIVFPRGTETAIMGGRVHHVCRRGSNPFDFSTAVLCCVRVALIFSEKDADRLFNPQPQPIEKDRDDTTDRESHRSEKSTRASRQQPQEPQPRPSTRSVEPLVWCYKHKRLESMQAYCGGGS